MMSDDDMPVPVELDADGPLRRGVAFDAEQAARARQRSLRNKLLGAALMGGLTVGVSVMSCVGQSFSLRQARALEGIEKRLELIQQHCEAR